MFPPESTEQDIKRICDQLSHQQWDSTVRSRFCALVSGNRGPNDPGAQRRTRLVESLNAIASVDCAGKLLHNTDELKTLFNDDKGEFLKQYKFYICPENASVEGYVTEKAFHAIGSGCIPIYWGACGNPEPDVLNRGAILFWNPDDDNSTLLRDLLKGTVPTYKVPSHKFNQKGHGEGVLVGGNMATFVPLVGASDIDVFSNDGIILFLEEVGESLHNIDRMFNTLELHGVMENVKGVILGEFVSSGMDQDFESTEEMLSKYLKKYDIPVLCGFPAGHDDLNVPIVMGAKVTLDVDKNGGTVAFNIDGEKKTVNTNKLTVKTMLSIPLRKMLSGKTFSIE
jgi:hypothetical protein